MANPAIPITEPGQAKTKSQREQLVELASVADLFHTPEGEGWASVPVKGHRENWRIRRDGFKKWLRQRYWQKHQKAPGTTALQDAVEQLDAKAQFQGNSESVYLRIAGSGGNIYIDLANDQWEVVEITPTGWRVISDPPVRFRRAPGMLELPYPTGGGTVDVLRRYLNLDPHDEAAWVLVVTWLSASCRPTGPFPILILQGPQGSAKSTMVRVLRRLVDPSTAALRTVSRDERDFQIAATNSWVVAVDNLSGIQPWFSDALCRVATGGGSASRTLYTDTDETILDALAEPFFTFLRALQVDWGRRLHIAAPRLCTSRIYP